MIFRVDLDDELSFADKEGGGDWFGGLFLWGNGMLMLGVVKGTHLSACSRVCPRWSGQWTSFRFNTLGLVVHCRQRLELLSQGA